MFKPVYLSANTQVDALIKQAKEFMPEAVCIADPAKFNELQKGLEGTKIICLAGSGKIPEMIKSVDADLVLNAIVGAAGMQSTVTAVEQGLNVALSNKESLVMAGELINSICAKTGSKIFPVDSEHSAIWQCMAGESEKDVEKITLTGSGGPFLRRDIATFADITPEEALKHPNWSMGSKITVDSATMFNKGLELIEAYHLFNVNVSQIDILIHPESIIHSMVQFKDGSVKAQLGVPDMKVPIQYAMGFPRHLPSDWPRLDLSRIGKLHFEKPDHRRFPSLKLAEDALKAGGTYPAVLNMANERAVYRFLNREITFTDIFTEVEKALNDHKSLDPLSFEDLLLLSKLS